VKPILRQVAKAVVGGVVLPLLDATVGPQWRGPLLRRLRDRPTFYVARGETAIVCGVHRAETVRSFLDAVGPRGRLMIIEANPATQDRLQRRFLDASNLVWVSCGVWNGPGSMEFLVGEDYQGFNRLDNARMQPFPERVYGAPRKISIRTASLDQIAAEAVFERADHLNLTINGAELQALDGIARLRAGNPRMRIAITTEMPHPGEAVVDTLRTMGYRVWTQDTPRHLQINQAIRLAWVYAVSGDSRGA